jgi:hypothetical protein
MAAFLFGHWSWRISFALSQIAPQMGYRAAETPVRVADENDRKGPA